MSENNIHQREHNPTISLLLVEKDPGRAKSFQDYFVLQGYLVAVASNLEQSKNLLGNFTSFVSGSSSNTGRVTTATTPSVPNRRVVEVRTPDMVLVDLSLLDIAAPTGEILDLNLLRTDQRKPQPFTTRPYPILVFSDNNSIENMLGAFSAGADYYELLKTNTTEDANIWQPLAQRLQVIFTRKLKRGQSGNNQL